MTIEISTGLKAALLAGEMNVKKNYTSTTLSLGDGDGTGGLDTINDTSGLSVFPKHGFVKVLTPEGDANRNKLVKVISSSASQLEVPAGSFTALAAGPEVTLLWYDIGGCFRSIFQNCVIRLFNEARPSAGADAPEPGSPICEITLGGAAFTPGEPLAGLNFGDMVDSVLRRAIDPETAAPEVHRGTPTQSVAANSFRCYANNMITGQSVNSIRFDGSVTGPSGGGDMIIDPSNVLSTETPVDITEVRIELKATALI